MFGFFKKKDDLDSIISKINLNVEHLAKRVPATQEAIRSLRLVKKEISRISELHQKTDGGVLEHIRLLTQNAIYDPDQIEHYADRICQHVEEYLFQRMPYDAVKEEAKDKELKTFAEIHKTVLEAESLSEKMQRLVDEKISKGYSVDSPRYRELVGKYNQLQSQLAQTYTQLSLFQKQADQNQLVANELARAGALQRAALLRTMSLEEFSRVATQNKMDEELFMETCSCFEAVAAETASSLALPTTDFDFQRAVEKTLLERIHEQSKDESFSDRIAGMNEIELYSAIGELSRKIDAIQSRMTDEFGRSRELQNEQLRVLTALRDKTVDEAMLLADTGGNVESVVEHFLSMKPIELQAAALKLRSCIENYCRYIKGIKLSDSLLFSKNESVKSKLLTAGFDETTAETLANIYRNTNPYIHGEDEKTSFEDEDKKVAAFREAAKLLREWGIDRYDPQSGVPKLYQTHDEMLRKKLDSGEIQVEDTTSPRSGVAFFLNDQNRRREYMEKNGISVPSICFSTLEDVRAYLEKTAANALQAAEEQLVVEPLCQEAIPQRKIGTVNRYWKEKGMGEIDGVFFYSDSFEGTIDPQEIKIGMKVSYEDGENKKGKCAKKIRPIEREEA